MPLARRQDGPVSRQSQEIKDADTVDFSLFMVDKDGGSLIIHSGSAKQSRRRRTA
jgi:hypothetical protein